jgi:hypothetical protein
MSVIAPIVFFSGLIALYFVLGGAMPSLGFVGVVAVILLLWWVTIAIFPEKWCWRCKGRGFYRGPLHLRRECGNCKGSGRVPRVGSGS